MALILDKQKILNTTDELPEDIIISGDSVYMDDDCGYILNDPYIIIDKITIDKPKKFIKITALLYKDKESKLNNKKYIKFYNYDIIYNDNNLYDQYFSIENMDSVNIYRAAYLYLNNEIFTHWMSDEN